MNNPIFTSISNVWGELILGLASSVPVILGGILTLIAGFYLGNLAKSLVVKTLQAINFDKLIKNTKFRQFLAQAELTEKVEVMLGSLIKWLIIITFSIAATNIWGLTTVSTLLMGILSYIPSIISAIIVLALGVLLAGFVEGMVKAGFAGVDVRTGRLMGKISSYLVVTIATLAAFSELHIAESFINTLFIGFVATLSLGMGLAIGLGAKDTVNKLLGKWLEKLQKELN